MRHLPAHLRKHILKFACTLALMLCFGVQGFAREITVSEREWVSGETASFSLSKNFPFTVAGGAVLGSSTPMRAYIGVEGVASGDGTMRATIDGNAGSEVDIAFPGGSDAREFSMVIPDIAGLLAHTSAGTYNHTLTLDPGGVTVTVNSVHVSNTYTWELGFDCPEGATSTTKQKTIQKLLGSDIDVSATHDIPISYNLVDNITGLPNPVTSAYVEVVGDYTSGGTLTMSFPEDPSLTVSYDLPASDGPRQISLLSANAMSLFQSSTSSSHAIDIVASGATMNNVSAKFVMTYVYHPAAINCGGFPATGELTSEVLDTHILDALYNSIAWRGSLGGTNHDTGRVRFQMATSPCSNGASDYPACGSGSWNWVGGSTCSSSDWFEAPGSGMPLDLLRTGCLNKIGNGRYYRYKVELCALDCSKSARATPTVNEVYVSWSP